MLDKYIEKRFGLLEKRISDLEKLLISDDNAIKSTTKKVSTLKQDTKEPQSIMDFLILLRDRGFFDTPRSRKDILQKLASMNKYYDPTSLDSPLNRAFTSKKLGRILKNGLYLYVKR